MLDIRFIRENAGLIEEKSRQKGYAVDVQKILALDSEVRELTPKVEELRRQRRELAETARGGKPSDEQIQRGQKIKNELNPLLEEWETKMHDRDDLLKQVPNLPADDVPVGASEAENKVVKEWGEKPQFDFKPKTHWQIAEPRGLIDKERAAKVSGSRFAYITGDLVRLQFALVQFVIDLLTNEETLKSIVQTAGLSDVSTKPFRPVLPPLMLRTDVFDAMDRLEPREERYKVGSAEDNLWLQGSAEHTLGPIYMNETINSAFLPIRLLGYATSFRREAGSYGKDTEGIVRMHQFDKLEMESFTKPEDGLKEHLMMVAIQEYILQQLKIPYRVILKCTADIGKPNARGIDLEAWLPGGDKYMETHTADYMTDYQARRLKTKVKILSAEVEKKLAETGDSGLYDTADAKVEFVHTNDATALALGRGMVAIIENYQQADGKITVPDVLQKYMNGQTQL